MIYSTFFSTLSLSVICGFSILLVLVSLAVGNFFGRRAMGHGKVGESSIGSAVAATLGLLAFMLAFTFNMAADRFNQRKTLLLNEANALGTIFLRTDLLPPDDRNRARELIAEYVDLRDIDPLGVPDFEERLARTEAVQSELWRLVARLSAEGYDGERLRGFYDTLNEVIDFHTSRLYTGLRYQIPPPIWGALYALTALAMFGIGFQSGASRRGSLQVAISLALAFSVVIVLIVDLDRSYEGVLIVDQVPMSELNARLAAEIRRQRRGDER